jgi:protocatechuate 3,4-dioxygenase beta subunit
MSQRSIVLRPAPSNGRRAFLGAVGAFGAAALVGRPLRAQDADSIEGIGCVDPSVYIDGFETPLSSCALIPQETQGPYPLLSVLSNPAMVRRDITEGRPGVPLTMRLKLVDINANCAPIADAGVYVWHCDKDGVYSGYQQPGANTVGQTFCRGLQYTDCNGEVAFDTMYPGWYAGRITHVHFQVYLTTGGAVTATSQNAFPPAVTQAVYASSLYAAHGQNTSVASIAQDNVFSDGYALQMPTVTGDTTTGYVARLAIGVAR